MHISKALIGIGAVALLAGCGNPYATSTNTTTNTAANTALPVVAGQITEQNVTLTEYSISPATIEFTANATATLTIKNEGTIAHTFTSPDLGIDKTVQPGTTETVQVTPTKAGTFEAHCTMPGHQALGMTAKVIVSNL